MNKLGIAPVVIVIIGLIIVMGVAGYLFTQSGKQNSPVVNSDVENTIPQIKEFKMTAQNWEFSPSKITVKKGDTVLIHITSQDITHGFSLPAYGISKKLEPGKTVDIEFVANRAGTFPWACNVPCGSGHAGMQGTLLVLEK